MIKFEGVVLAIGFAGRRSQEQEQGRSKVHIIMLPIRRAVGRSTSRAEHTTREISL